MVVVDMIAYLVLLQLNGCPISLLMNCGYYGIFFLKGEEVFKNKKIFFKKYFSE